MSRDRSRTKDTIIMATILAIALMGVLTIISVAIQLLKTQVQ